MKHIITLFILFITITVKSQIITEDILMHVDTCFNNSFTITTNPNITTLELIRTPYYNMLDIMPTYGPKFVQDVQLEKFQSEVDELKSQVKELSFLLQELLKNKSLYKE